MSESTVSFSSASQKTEAHTNSSSMCKAPSHNMLVCDHRPKVLLYTHSLRHTHAFNTDLLFNQCLHLVQILEKKKVCFNAKMLHTFIKKRRQILFIYNLLTLKAQKENDPTWVNGVSKGTHRSCNPPFKLTGTSFLEKHNQSYICNLHRSDFRAQKMWGQCICTASDGSLGYRN